ncbi:MAG: hypothetical protein IJU23_09600 [Proteobacteria bacterium]|nr:hypothetical protein [Pseudomonadota bacterium]
MNIMTALFDQDEVTRSLIAAKEARASKLSKVDDIKKMMLNLNLTLQQALNAIDIPESERDYYIQQIEGKKGKK